MNWILPFMMLKLLSVSWAKPIDSAESHSELQTGKEALKMQINLTFALIDEANNLNRRLENTIIKSTEIVPNELSQKLKESSTRSQYETENSPELIEALEETTNSSNDYQNESVATHPQHIFSTSTISTLAPSENSPNDSKNSLSSKNIDKNFTATKENENDTNVEVKLEAEDSLGITTELNAANAEQVTQQSENTFEQTTMELSLDTTAATTQATFEMLQEDVSDFHNHSQEIIKNVTENVKEKLEKTTVDNPDTTELTNLETHLNNLMNASTPEKIFIRPLNPVGILNTIANESTEIFLSSNSEKIQAQENTSTGDQGKDSSETSAHKQTVDSLIHQEASYSGHIESIGNSGDEEIAVASMIQPITQDADTSTDLNEIKEDSDNSIDLKSEKISEQKPTPKRALDGFSEKIVDGQIESTTTEIDREILNQGDNITSAKLKLDSIKTENKDDIQDDTTSTTVSVLDNLKENQEQEISSVNTEFSTTNDNLIGTTLSHFEKSEIELFSTNENTPEAVTESSSESSPQKTNNENLNNLNLLTSTFSYSTENFPEVTTNNFNEVSMTTQTSPISKENVKGDDEKADIGKNLLLESQENGIQQNTEAASLKTKTLSEENNEDVAASRVTTEQPEIATHFETIMVKDNINGTELEVLEPQETSKISEIIEDTKESRISENTENAISNKSLTPNEDSTATNEITTESHTTSSQIAQESLTSDHSETEEMTHEFAKLENSSMETIPSASITLSVKFTTVSPLEETKVSTEKLQEKLKEAVKVLAKEMKKIAIRETEHVNQDETTTFKTAPTETTTELVASIEPLRKHTTPLNAAADETSIVPDKTDDVTTQKLSDRFEEESDDSITTSQNEWQLRDPEQIKKSRAVFDATLPPVKEIGNVEKDEINVTETTTTTDNDVKDNIVATTTEDCVTAESTNQAEIATTEEYIAKTTNAATLARVSLLKDVNNISLHANIAPVTEVPTQDINIATANETRIESTTIMQPTEPIEETIILTSSETSLQEHTDTTTFIQPSLEKEDNEVISQTQETPTQSSFMEEQQQQVEITTEQDAQTASAVTSGQTATTINYEQQQTTEAEIYSTTEEEVDDKPTNAAVESEARSLPLSPPKLEYSQSEDGVEVFYGYSKVNHN